MTVTMGPRFDDGMDDVAPYALPRTARELAELSDSVVLGRVTSAGESSMTMRVLLDIAGQAARTDGEIVIDALPGPVSERGPMLAFLVAGAVPGHYRLTNPAGLVVGDGVRPRLPLVHHCPRSLVPLVESLLVAGINGIVREAQID